MKKQKGFTLIELLVVIAIIGLLSTLAVVALNNARQKSRDARRVSDIKQIQTALELYFNDNGTYPAEPAAATCYGTATVNDISGCCLSSTTGFGAPAGCAGTIYMAEVPSNPSPNGDEYTYNVSGTSDQYSIEYNLEGTAGGIDAGANTACSSGIEGCTAQ